MRYLDASQFTPVKYPYWVSILAMAFSFCCATPSLLRADDWHLDAESSETLTVPTLSQGGPAAGKRVAVTAAEYVGTEVFHTLYLPPGWKPEGAPVPIIFEYTGNYYPQSGSTGKSQDAALGYGLSGGKYIWVVLPYVNSTGTANEVTWWGDEQATVEYAKQNVPLIIEQFGGDPNAVFLCGFSRGAIGVNYLGLRDDEVASLWTAFITHDHFDGVREWNTAWGSPLERYQSEAKKRLAKVENRPYWVSQNGNNRKSEEFVRSVVPIPNRFRFSNINTAEILGSFPNEFAQAAHTDRWLLRPSRDRRQVWEWMERVASGHNKDGELSVPGQLKH
ncbi:hypothetical protein [Aureliella helgolandensis]|uniref:Alpha/beta hydrolase family protein n=1 Tax=Aureliella helgolandensis TaxID=2527968 RepID=A0A518GAT3_9BACT|nr:hypothetical protein [Aureliella helgolandensis]QDV25714.1 hypothetical protein Q31a_40410 [Aureliella helgolandensis]